MALYDSADLLRRCADYFNRPTDDEKFGTTFWYDRLTEAQAFVYGRVAAHCPQLLIGAPTLLTSSDGGVTYPFGTDTNGYAMTPLYVEVYARVNGRELLATTYDGPGDFVIEATQIRMPNNRARALTSGPYARYIAPPGAISASSEPTFTPAMDRMLLVWKALELACTVEGARDPMPYASQFAMAWGDCLTKWKTQYSTQWASENGGNFAWWHAMRDVAVV
jgi:hypothetical protein